MADTLRLTSDLVPVRLLLNGGATTLQSGDGFKYEQQSLQLS